MEEILAQWVYLSRTSRLERLKLDSDLEKQSTPEEKVVLQRRKVMLTSEVDRLTAMIPAFIERVNANRKASVIAAAKAALAGTKGEGGEEGEGVGKGKGEGYSDGESRIAEAKIVYKYGEELDMHTLFDLKEQHAFERNVYWSKQQAYAEYNQQTDTFDWEQTLDAEHSLEAKEHSLEEPSKDSAYLLSDVFYFKEKGKKSKGQVEASSDLYVIPLPSDSMMCLLTKLYAKRGAWDSCLRVCHAMVMQEVDKRASLSVEGGERGVGQIGGEEDVLKRHIERVSSPLNVCLRHTVAALCSNGQYDAAFQLINTVKPLGVPVTPSTLALLLRTFEVNEDLSRVDMTGEEGGLVTLIDFQAEILNTCIVCAAFERRIHGMLHTSDAGEGQGQKEVEGQGGVGSSISGPVSSTGDVGDHSSSSSLPSESESGSGSGSERMWQRNHTRETLEDVFDQCSTGALIFINVKLLCERGGCVFSSPHIILTCSTVDQYCDTFCLRLL